MTGDLERRWDRFLVSFFGAGNDLDYVGSPLPALTEFLEANRRALQRPLPGPFLLPRRLNEETTYFAIALSDRQAQELRRVLFGVVGPTYTDFDGRSVESEIGDPVLEATIALAGSPRRVFCFAVPRSASTDTAKVRDQARRVLSLFEQRPLREVDEVIPFGRLLREFESATAEGDRRRAEKLLFGPIRNSGQLSGANRLFLHICLLAGFDDWEQLDVLPNRDDVLRYRRPALVSDGLAQFALRSFTGTRESSVVEAARFTEDIASTFEALIPTVESIRSDVGAEYYTLWHLSTGTSPDELRLRFDGLRWGQAERVLRHLDRPQAPSPAKDGRPTDAVSAIRAAYQCGDFDEVLDRLGQVEPTHDLVSILVGVMPPVMTSRVLDLMTRFRRSLGDSAFDAALAEISQLLSIEPPAEEKPSGRKIGGSWPDRLRAVAERNLGVQQFNEMVAEGDVLDLIRSPEALDELVTTMSELIDDPDIGTVVDGVLDLTERLAAATSEPHRLRALRETVTTIWLLGDDGDLDRAGRILNNVEALLELGNSTADYRELVSTLTSRWSNFLTVHGFGLSLRAIELLVSSSPPGLSDATYFAGPVFGRLTPSVMRRLDLADLFVAKALATELGIRLPDAAEAITNAARLQPELPGGYSIGIYSLDVGAIQRARAVLVERFPSLKVVVSSATVATDALVEMSRSVDLMVMAIASAKHAATNGIRANRGSKAIVTATGKGSSSLIRAVLGFLEGSVGGKAA